MHNDRVVAYYNATHDDYLGYLGDQFHFGFWDGAGEINIYKAMQNANQEVADYLEISRGDVILDAGCGVGGTVRYIADRYDIEEIVGITITQKLVKTCITFSELTDRQHVMSYYDMDYCHTTFSDGYFNKVYAIESVCHTDDKNGFAQEAFRLLRPGGILVINDYSRTDKPFIGEEEEKNFSRFLKGWALHHLETVKSMKQILLDAGFKSVEYHDKTNLILPFSKNICAVKHNQLVDMAMLVSHGEYSRELFSHSTATVVQYELFKNGIMQQGIFKVKK